MLGLGRGNSYSSLSLGGWNHFAVKQIFYFSDIIGHLSKQGRIYSKRIENPDCLYARKNGIALLSPVLLL